MTARGKGPGECGPAALADRDGTEAGLEASGASAADIRLALESGVFVDCDRISALARRALRLSLGADAGRLAAAGAFRSAALRVAEILEHADGDVAGIEIGESGLRLVTREEEYAYSCRVGTRVRSYELS